ncbi:hypothetical protein BMW22_37640 (plasmid) [Rhizobium leguminosarum]|uniref:Uncharacterized protein n=1 Tax=Rhizobium leguminosarum TaxID=384 RepID=A0A1L3ZNA7_RHILE|nr:hypothetical protein BMW22_37640 [Rhizobium leguminosarum]
MAGCRKGGTRGVFVIAATAQGSASPISTLVVATLAAALEGGFDHAFCTGKIIQAMVETRYHNHDLGRLAHLPFKPIGRS